MNSESVSHQEVLKLACMGRMAKNPSYSLRAFARDLQLSHSHLSRVMNGKKNLSLGQALKISAGLNLSPEAKADFLRSVTEKSLRDPVSSPPKNLVPNSFDLEVEQFKFLREWYHSAILEMTSLENFQPKHSWVAKQLGLTTRQVRAASARLQKLGLLEISPEGWKRTHRHFVVSTKGASQAIRAHHEQMIEKALENLRSQVSYSFTRRDITGTTLAINPKDLPLIAKKIRSFRHSLMQFVDRNPSKELYQLNVQLFPLTSVTKAKKERKNV